MAMEKQIKVVATATTTDRQEGTSKIGHLENRTVKPQRRVGHTPGHLKDFFPIRDFMAIFPLTHRLKRLGILDSLGSAGFSRKPACE